MDMITREEIIKAIKKLGEMPKERPSIEEMEKNIALCKKSIDKVQLIHNILKEENTTYKIEELDVDSFYDEIKGYETLDFESAVLGITDKINEVIRRINNERL